MIEIRKTITLRETVFSELGVEAARPITRAVGMAVNSEPIRQSVRRGSKTAVRGWSGARRAADARFGEVARRTRCFLRQGRSRWCRWRNGARRCVRSPDARQTNAGGDRRRKGGHRIECEGGGGGRFARRTARAQGRFLVVPAFRYDYGLGGRCASTRRNPGRDGDR